MKAVILITISFGFFTNTFGQITVNPELVNGWHSSFEGNGIQAYTALGEIAIDLFHDSNVGISQGFYQGGLRITNVYETHSDAVLRWNIFPNPFSSTIQIEAQNQTGSGFLQILDFKGNLLIKRQIGPYDRIELSGLNPGAYILNISNGAEASEIATFRIIKVD